jgi:hypothetical protein
MKLTMAVLVLAVCAGSAWAVVIDFEKYPGPDGALGTPDDVPIVAPSLFANQPLQITNQFASLGIQFLPNPPLEDRSEILIDQSFERTAGTRPNLLSTNRVIHPFGRLEARFTVPVFSVRMAIGLGSVGSVRPNILEIFDVNSNLIDSVTASDAFVTLTSPVRIDRFRVTATISTNQASIDDIEFTPVPEPAALVLALCCAVVVLPRFAARKRERAAA